MQVVLVNDHACLNGGVARVAISEAKGLTDMGHDVIFFSGSGPIDTELREYGIHTICLEQEEFLKRNNKAKACFSGIHNRSACTKLEELLRTLNPSNTVVHYHSWMKTLSPAILGVAHARGFKSLLTLHDYFLTCPNGGLINHQNKSICKLKPGSISCHLSHCDSRSRAHKAWRSVRSDYQRFLIKPSRKIDQFIAVSPLCKTQVKESIANAPDIDVLLNPVDAASDKASDPGSHGEFVFAGRLSAEKGLSIVMDAIEGSSLKLKVIGEGPEELSNSNPNIRWLGWKPHNEVIEEIRHSRALIFPSTWLETFGLTVFEAMANGIPVIVSDCTAAGDFIQNGINGLKFKSRDIEDLRRKLTELDQDKKLARKLGTQAYQWFNHQSFDLSSHVKSLLSIYERTLGNE